jgi:spermidine/putrescine transport system permease protein
MSRWRKSTAHRAAADLGDGPVRIFRSRPLAARRDWRGVLIFVPTTGDYVTPTLVGGTDGVMIANLIQVQFARVGNWPLGAALAISSMASVAVLALLFVQAARLTIARIR